MAPRLLRRVRAQFEGDGARLWLWQVRVFLLCWVAYFLTYLGRMNLSVALSALEAQFQSGKAAVGLLGSLFFWVYAVGKLANGYLGDKANNRWQVFFGLAVSGAANLLIGFAGNIWLVTLLWGINGFAQSALWCNIISLVSHWYYPRQHANIAVWLSTSMVGGALAGWGGCGWLIGHLPWQWVFIVPGVILIGFGVVWLLLMKNKASDAGFEGVGTPLTPAGGKTASKQPVWKFVFTAGLVPIIVACLAQGVIKDGIGLWGPTMVQDAYALDAGTASFLLLFIPVMNFFGISAAGALQSKFKMSDFAASVALMAAGAGCIVGLRVFMGRSLVGGVVWLGLASAVMYGVNTVLLGVFPLRFARAGRVSFVSGLLDFSSYLAAGLSSVFAGYVLDKGLGWNSVFVMWLVLTLLGIAALFFSRKSGKDSGPNGA